MKVWILNLEQPDQVFSADVRELRYEKKTGEFSMARPMGDDWLQRIFHIQEPRPEFFHQLPIMTIIVFDSSDVAAMFLTWLVGANSEADSGFRTMRG